MNLRNTGKVLYITSIDVSEPKGPSINEREFMWALHRMFGDRVRFLVTRPAGHIPEMQSFMVEYLDRIDYHRPLSYIAHQVSLYRQGMQVLHDKGYQLIITRPSLIPIGLICLLKRSKVPLVIKHLSGHPDYFVKSQKGFKRMIAKIIVPIETFLLKNLVRESIGADCCTQGHVRGVLRNLEGDTNKIVWIDNATNCERFQPRDTFAARNECGLSAYEPVVGFAGGRPWERGGREMLKVAPQMIKEFPCIGFVIVGGGDGLRDLKKEADKLGVQDHFVFTGVVPYDAVPRFINAFDVAIAFDRADILNSIGNSNQKIRQYIASGKPVITTPGGNDFITRNQLGSIVNPSDINDIIMALRNWLCLTESEKRTHAEKAAAYAREHLSIMSKLEQRVDFWSRALG